MWDRLICWVAIPQEWLLFVRNLQFSRSRCQINQLPPLLVWFDLRCWHLHLRCRKLSSRCENPSDSIEGDTEARVIFSLSLFSSALLRTSLEKVIPAKVVPAISIEASRCKFIIKHVCVKYVEGANLLHNWKYSLICASKFHEWKLHAIWLSGCWLPYDRMMVEGRALKRRKKFTDITVTNICQVLLRVCWSEWDVGRSLTTISPASSRQNAGDEHNDPELNRHFYSTLQMLHIYHPCQPHQSVRYRVLDLQGDLSTNWFIQWKVLDVDLLKSSHPQLLHSPASTWRNE